VATALRWSNLRAHFNGFAIETLDSRETLLIVPIGRRPVRDRCRSGTPTLHVSPETFRQTSTTHHASG